MLFSIRTTVISSFTSSTAIETWSSALEGRSNGFTQNVQDGIRLFVGRLHFRWNAVEQTLDAQGGVLVEPAEEQGRIEVQSRYVLVYSMTHSLGNGRISNARSHQLVLPLKETHGRRASQETRHVPVDVLNMRSMLFHFEHASSIPITVEQGSTALTNDESSTPKLENTPPGTVSPTLTCSGLPEL